MRFSEAAWGGSGAPNPELPHAPLDRAILALDNQGPGDAMNRRKLLLWVVRGIGAGTAAIVGVPAVATLLSPVIRQRRQERWQPVGPVDAFVVNSVEKVAVDIPNAERPRSLRHKAVFVWRRSEDDIVVYSRNCTDLSCPVTWDEGSGWFFCPCHGGIFNREGEPMAGPPSVPLYRYRTRRRDGMLEIDLNSLPPMT